jgi:predicted transcriptional regulator
LLSWGAIMGTFPLLGSRLKLKILLSLLEREKKLSDLRTDIGIRETSILHALKDLEEAKLSAKSSGVYKLTSLGFMEAQITKEYSSAAGLIEKFKEFWLLHDVTAIPPHLMLKIGALKTAYLVRPDASELSKVHEAFLQLLSTAKRILGISPIFHPDFVPLIDKLLREGTSVELIVTSAVLKKILASARVDQLKEDFKEERVKIFLREDLRVALTVTERNFSLGLFNLSGEYDDKMDLISLSREAIEWGEELFRDFIKGGRRVGADAVA